MPNHSLNELRTHLFEVLENLRDKRKTPDLDRARVVSEVAQTFINSVKVEVDMVNALAKHGVRPQQAAVFAPHPEQLIQPPDTTELDPIDQVLAAYRSGSRTISEVAVQTGLAITMCQIFTDLLISNGDLVSKGLAPEELQDGPHSKLLYYEPVSPEAADLAKAVLRRVG